MHKIEQRPVVVSGQIEIRPVMYVALSYDHRIVDGREAVQFLLRILNDLRREWLCMQEQATPLRRLATKQKGRALSLLSLSLNRSHTSSLLLLCLAASPVSENSSSGVRLFRSCRLLIRELQETLDASLTEGSRAPSSTHSSTPLLLMITP